MARSPSINQVNKHAEFPQTQYIDKFVDMPVVMQRLVFRIQTGLKIVEAPPAQFVGRVVDVPAITQARKCPSINQVTKHAEFPQSLFVDTVVDLPVVMQRQVARM